MGFVVDDTQWPLMIHYNVLLGPAGTPPVKYSTARSFMLSLAGVSEKPHFHLASFRVNKKIFCTALPEQTHLNIFVDEIAREQALELYPDSCEKLWWGKKVVGLRVSLAHVKPTVVKELLHNAWLSKSAS